MKYAISFRIKKLESGKIEYVEDSDWVIGEEIWLSDVYDFDCDYWEWFKEEDLNPDIKILDVGEYWVFSYGDVSVNGGTNYWDEYDCEIIFEPDYTTMNLLS